MKQKEAVHYFLVETETLQFGVVATTYDVAVQFATEVLEKRYPEDSKEITSICMIAMYDKNERLIP